MRATEFLTESIIKTNKGWQHSGFGYKNNPVYPLPRWSVFNSGSRNKEGSWEDILHYFRFLDDNYATAMLDITGDEIATVLCLQGHTDKKQELEKMKIELKLKNSNFQTWSEVFNKFKENSKKERATRLGGI